MITTNNFVWAHMIEYRKEPILGYEEYQVDTNGVVYNKDGSVKKYSVNHSGYRIVTFIVNRKRKSFAIHTLVAKQFIPNPNGLPQVNHKDGNKENNCVENLEWCTAKYNTKHSYEVLHREPSGKKEIIGIDRNSGDIIYHFDSLANAGRYFANGKNFVWYQNSVYKALSGRRKTYKNCYWEYVE